MASIWSRNTDRVVKTPGLFTFGSVLFAWIAGLDLNDLIHKVRMHNAVPLDFAGSALLLVALLWSYQVARTIRQLNARRPASSSPVQTK